MNENYIFDEEKEQERIAENIELNKKLKSAIDALDKNRNFKFLVEYYTKETVLENAQNAVISPEIRASLFEVILSAKHFEKFLNEIRNIRVDEENKDN